MDGDEESSYACVNGFAWEGSPRKTSQQRSSGGSNSDLGDMSFMMFDYIKEAMKVYISTYPQFLQFSTPHT